MNGGSTARPDVVSATVKVVGDSSTALQAVPFAVGVAGPATVYLVARLLALARPAAVVAAAVLATSPMAVTYATRVKPYTLDTLLGLAVVALAWRLLDDPGDGRRAAHLAVVATLAVVISGPTAITVGSSLAVVALAGWRARTPGPALWTAGTVGAFATVWYVAVLRPASGPGLRDYWAASYPSTDGPAALVGGVARLGVEVARGLSVVPPGLTVVVLGACAVLVAVRRPLLAALLIGPVVATAAAAALALVPFGGGRTDAHLYGSLVLLAAVGLHEAARALPRPAPTTVAVAATAGLALLSSPAPAYPSQDVRPLVAALEAGTVEGDAVLVYSATRPAFTLYTSGPIAFVGDSGSLNGFVPVLGDPAVTVLDPQRADPSRHAPAVAAATAGRDRVWLLSSHESPDFAAVEAALVAGGYERAVARERAGARLSRWDRVATTG